MLSIRCILCSSKLVAEIKFSSIDDITFLELMNKHKVFIEANHLSMTLPKLSAYSYGSTLILSIGMYLKRCYTTSSRLFRLTLNKLLPLTPPLAIIINEWWIVLITLTLMFHHLNFLYCDRQHSCGKSMPKPKLWCQCNMKHYTLLCKVFSQLFTCPPLEIAHINFSLSGIISIIGSKVHLRNFTKLVQVQKGLKVFFGLYKSSYVDS